MSNVARLKAFLGSRGISYDTLRRSFNVCAEEITEETAADIEARVANTLAVAYDEDEFSRIAMAHGFDNETLSMLAKIEMIPPVLDMFQ
jgi:hypothetical protein